MCGWQLTESSLAPSKNAIATKPTDLPSASCDLDLWHLTPKVYRFMSLPPGPLESVRFQNIVFISLTTDEWMKKSTDMLTTLCLVSDCQSRLVEAQKRCTTRKRHHCFNVVHCPIWGLRCGHLWGSSAALAERRPLTDDSPSPFGDCSWQEVHNKVFIQI